MAKKEVGLQAAPSDYKSRVHLDLEDASQLKGLEIGQVVTVAIKGKVRSLEQRQHWDDPKRIVSSICVEQDDLVIKGKNVFEELAEDDED